MVSAPALTPNVRYDSLKDFSQIGLTANAPVAVVAQEGFPRQGPQGIHRLHQGHGDSVKQAHGGIGSSSHMACLLFTTRDRREAAGRSPIAAPARRSTT